MKVLLITVALFAFTAAEAPLSKSYLPPPATRSSGYPKGPQSTTPFNAGVPEVVAARTLGAHGQENHGNNFARNNLGNQEDVSRFSSNGEHNEHNGFGRSAIEDASGPANYNFGYMVNDHQEGTEFGHHEERLEESAHGQYHVVLPDGRRQTVSYQADARGFKPRVSYQDTEEITRSEYDSNASNVRSTSSNHGNEFGRTHDDFGRNNDELGRNHDEFGRNHDEFGRNHATRSNGY